MIAAVNPTRASSRSGTPAPRSDSASSPLATSLTIGATVLDEGESMRFAHAVVFSRFIRIGRLPEPLRAQLAPEGILHVAERVRVTQRFSARRAFRPECQTPDRVGGVHPQAPLRVAAHLPPLKRT